MFIGREYRLIEGEGGLHRSIPSLFINMAVPVSLRQRDMAVAGLDMAVAGLVMAVASLGGGEVGRGETEREATRPSAGAVIRLLSIKVISQVVVPYKIWCSYLLQLMFTTRCCVSIHKILGEEKDLWEFALSLQLESLYWLVIIML